MRRKFWALLMTIMMIATMVPASAFADEMSTDDEERVTMYEVASQGKTIDEGGLYTSKSLALNEDGTTGTITLEAYSKGVLETSEITKPVDVVLVLDVSGSMDKCIECGEEKGHKNHGSSNHSRHDFKSRIGSLKDGVNSFINTVYDQSLGADRKAGTDDDVDNRIAIVKFAGNNKTKVGDDKYNDGRFTYNYTQIVKTLTSANRNKDELISAVSNLVTGGATSADYGMAHAKTIINGIDSDRDSNKVVVMFTDGEPTHSNGFERTVANAAISASKGIKEAGTSVYTVGIFSSPMSENVTNYMKYVSSNYPKASSLDDGGEPAEGANYYFTVNKADFSDIFKAIEEELARSQIDLNGESVVKDIISDKFEISEDGEIIVKTCSYEGDDADENPTWGTPEVAEDLTAVIGDDGKTVSVTGFDFSTEYICVKDDTPQGKKLIIEIPVTLTDVTLNGALISSNTEESGIYKTADDEDAMRDFGSPQVQKAVEINYKAALGGTVNNKKEDSEIVAHDGTANGATAKADKDYYFVNWTKDDESVVSAEPEFTPETRKATYTAHFAQKSELTLTAKDASKVYDGSELTNSRYDSSGLKDGHSIVSGVSVSGEITNAGKTDNVINADNIIIRDASGKDVTNQYKIKTVNGTLEVTPRNITITVNNAEKYFGESDPEFTGSITNGELVNPEDLGTISYSRTNEAEAVGEYDGVITANYKENKNYRVEVIPGNFTIKTASIQGAAVIAEGGSWVYDGKPHAASAEVTEAEGYTIYYKVGDGEWTTEAPSVTNVAEGTVTVNVKAVREGYEELNADPVTIEITPKDVIITSEDAEKVYDGKPLESKEITSEGFVEGEGITGEAVGSQTNVGSSNNSIEYAFNNNTQAGNYNVTKNEGVLTVTHAVLTVTADDKTKVQGTDNPELTGTITGFVNGEDKSVISGDAEYATTAKKNSAVGEYPIIVSEGTLNADNYIFEYVEGTLTITEKGGTEGGTGGDNGDNDKNDNGVKTGDNFNMWIYICLALVAVIAALAAVLTRKQRQR